MNEHSQTDHARIQNEISHKDAAQLETLLVHHPHAAGFDIASRSHWVCVGFTSTADSCLTGVDRNPLARGEQENSKGASGRLMLPLATRPG
jgi:hypothetical protein